MCNTEKFSQNKFSHELSWWSAIYHLHDNDNNKKMRSKSIEWRNQYYNVIIVKNHMITEISDVCISLSQGQIKAHNLNLTVVYIQIHSI
jgi:hypothetical protein